jgi:hypothetical protein
MKALHLLHCQLLLAVAMPALLSVILQDDAWADIGRLTENMTWTYVMISATF